MSVFQILEELSNQAIQVLIRSALPVPRSFGKPLNVVLGLIGLIVSYAADGWDLLHPKDPHK